MRDVDTVRDFRERAFSDIEDMQSLSSVAAGKSFA